MPPITPSTPSALALMPTKTSLAEESTGEKITHDVLAAIVSHLPTSEVYRTVSLSRSIYCLIGPSHYSNLYRSVILEFAPLPPINKPPPLHPKSTGAASKPKSHADKAKKLKYKAKLRARRNLGVAEDVTAGVLPLAQSRPKTTLAVPVYLFFEGILNYYSPPHHEHPFLAVPQSVRRLIPNPFAFTSHLTIPYHLNTLCSIQLPINLEMPNLHTLRVIPGNFHSADGTELLDLCCDPDRRRTDVKVYLDDTYPTCPLVAALRPKRVILGGVGTSFAGAAVGLWTEYIPFPPIWVEDITCYIGESINPDGPCIIFKLPPSVKRLTLVIQPASDRRGKWVRQTMEDEPWSFWTYLARACLGGPEVIEVVGVNDILPGWSGANYEEMKGDLRECMKTALRADGVHEKEIDAKLEAVSFMTRQVWEARERKGIKG